jgi:amicyanin
MRFPVLVVACVALAVPAGCGSKDNGGDSADKAPPKNLKSSKAGGQAPKVTMEDTSFKPTELSVKAGATVTWTNEDSVGHDVKSTGGPGGKYSSGAAGGLAKGDTFKHRFAKPGTYDYVCTVHPNMAGYVIVK